MNMKTERLEQSLYTFIIYEVVYNKTHNGVGLTYSVFYKTKKSAMNFAIGLISDWEDKYKTEYKVEYFFTEEKIKSKIDDTIYRANIYDTTNVKPQHIDCVKIIKRSLM